MLYFFKFIILPIYLFKKCLCVEEFLGTQVVSTKMFMFWPNATVPFYINPDHFDHEQAMAIMTSLSMFAFKTCLKFAPVMAAPTDNQHVMVFVNPDGIRRCNMEGRGHSIFTPHLVVVGYDCLQSPQIDMYIMRALGFPFEHNRMSRDVYIDVMIENIEPGSIRLFTKESVLPPILRTLPYDINSVMHFGERDFSKNGHRTIIIKNQSIGQNRVGLSTTDLRRIEMVYGTECRNRDRQEKIELCQSYPGVARRKREIRPSELRSLRVNPDITPPSSPPTPTTLTTEALEETTVDTEYITGNLKALGIEDEAQEILEQVYKVSALALKNVREKYCNVTSNLTFINLQFDKSEKKERGNKSDLLGILEIIADYAKNMVDSAVANLTVFCENSGSIDNYQRQPCHWKFDNRCPKNYRSTKSGLVRHSTRHAPVYKQMTKHEGVYNKYSYDKPSWRSGNDTSPTTETLNSDNATTVSVSKARRKREVQETATTPVVKEKKIKEKKILKEKIKKQKEKVEIKKDNETNLKDIKPGNASKEGNTGGTRRYFEEKRYKVKRPKDTSDGEWEGSNISMDKENQEKSVKDDSHKKGKMTELEKQRKIEKEKLKEIELEAEKLINQEEFGKEVDPNNEEIVDKSDSREKIKSQVDNEGNDQSKYSKEIDDNNEDIGKGAKQKPIDEEYAEKSVEKTVEKTVESEAKDEKNDEEKTVEKQVYDIDVDKSIEKKERVVKKSKAKHRKRSHANLPKTVKLNKLNSEFYNERRWPDGQVIYVIKQIREYDLEDLRNRLAEVNSILEKKTCVRLREVGAKEADGYDDYILLDTSPDYVTGRVGGKQIFGCVELFKGGQHRQHTAMMVMAMLGFYFEVSRHDRDKHIRVHMRHVRPDKLHHFEKIRDEATLDLPYDYKSATHPAWQFWRKIGKTGISTVATYKDHDPDGSVMRALGQHPQLLSDGDITKINSVYGIDCFLAKRGVDKENDETEAETEAYVAIQKKKDLAEEKRLRDEKEVEVENERVFETKENVSQ